MPLHSFWFVGTPFVAFSTSVLPAPAPGVAVEGCLLLFP
jgi:hypothetical protein